MFIERFKIFINIIIDFLLKKRYTLRDTNNY